LPPLFEQEAIAEVLRALDDKIAANAKLVSLIDNHMGLEYTAAVRGSASALPLHKVAEFHNRKRVPLSSREREQRRGDVPYYGASGVFGTVDTAIFDEPLVLVGEDRSVINGDGTPISQYIWGPAWVNNHAHVLTGKGISTELLFLAIRRTQVATLVTGAVQPKINMGNLKRLTLEIPAVDRRGRLEQIVKAETASKRAAIEENRMLATTRDALLPHLMSGKLRVKDAEKVLENAGV
jgi:type I restriction enzyme S subunit